MVTDCKFRAGKGYVIWEVFGTTGDAHYDRRSGCSNLRCLRRLASSDNHGNTQYCCCINSCASKVQSIGLFETQKRGGGK